MKHVFVDTNIIIDLITNREPFGKFAVIIFEKAEEKKVKLFVSTHSIATAHYLLKKHVDEKQLRVILTEVLDYMNVLSIDEAVIRKSLKSEHKDFEDAIQINTAGSMSKMDWIVTRNAKDFRQSHIPVIAPDELASFLQK